MSKDAIQIVSQLGYTLNVKKHTDKGFTLTTSLVKCKIWVSEDGKIHSKFTILQHELDEEQARELSYTMSEMRAVIAKLKSPKTNEGNTPSFDPKKLKSVRV